MSNDTATTAMTEIALALAMAFFSVMVLAIVSMGAGMPKSTAASKILVSTLVKASESQAGSPDTAAISKEPAEVLVSSEELLIFYGGRFFDANLNAVDPAKFSIGKGPLVLAVPPVLSFTDAASARHKVPSQNVTVTTLNDRWSQALKERMHE